MAGKHARQAGYTSDEALRYIVEKLTEAGIGLAEFSAYRCGGSGGVVHKERTTLPV